MDGRLVSGTFSAGIDWFIHAHVRVGDVDLLRRARLVVASAWTLILLAIIHAAVFFSMNSPVCATALGVGAGVGIGSLCVMRRTGSCFAAGNLLTAAFFGVMTALACRLGGQGHIALPWYAAVPVVALSTAGRRSAVFWLAVTSSSLAVFYALDCSGYSFPSDLAPHHHELFCLLSWTGLIVLVFGLALLYARAKDQMLRLVQESQQRYRAVVEDTPLLICTYLPDTTLTLVNEAYCRYFQRSREELLGRSFLELIPEEEHAAVREMIAGLTATATVRVVEHRVLAPDGAEGWQRWTNRAIFDPNGHLVTCQAIGEDITERKRAEEMLQESEVRHRILFEGSRDAIMTLAPPSWKFTSCNPATVEMFRTKDEAEFISLGPWELSPDVQPDGRPSADKAREMIEKAMRDGSHLFEWTHKRHRGEDFPATVLLTRVDLNGQAFLQATVRDITAQKQAENELRESEERFKGMFNNMSSGVAVYDAVDDGEDFVLIDFNPAGERINKIAREDVIGKRVTEAFPGVEQFGLLDVFRRVWRTGEAEYHPVSFYKDERITGWRENYVYRLPSGEIVAIYDDVTLRKRAEEKLRREKELSDDIINSLPGLFYVFDEERFVRWNEKWETVTGYSAEELEGMYGTDFFEGADKVLIAHRMQAVFREGASEAEAEIVTKDGRRIPFYFTGLRSMFDGKPHLVGLGIDITKQKQTEVELARARDEAEAANRAKSEFLANMSHEIRTPMTAILGFSEILMGCAADREQLDAAATIKQNGEYLIGIINDILDLSKIEAGKLQVEHIQCSPCQILSEVASLMRVRATAKNLPLEVEYDGPIPESIQSDPTRLRQILINLTGNAIKFTEAGKVRLVARLSDAESDEPKIQFDVVDSGIGMNDQQTARLFKPFSQVDASTTRKHGGTGLGLTISKRMAGKLGGGIAVKSTLGEGSTFTVTVGTGPLDGVKFLDKPTEAQLSTDSDEKPAARKAELDCRVLLAEDGPDNQRLIAFLLKKAGAEVVVADNGRIACDLALAARDEGTPFDVILMDMQMPVMDGYDATGRLREAGYAGPIIALTAHAMSVDRDKCLKAGCDDYMAKPIDHKKLVSLVAEYASRQELQSSR